MEPIILASGSPRRQEFFRLLGLPFTCIPAAIDETPPPGLSPQQAAEAIAQRKALAVAERSYSSLPKNLRVLRVPRASVRGSFPHWILAADTIVVLDNEILGKPANKDNARCMLKQLSGRQHEVITAMALCNTQRNTERATLDCRSAVSEVTFAPLSGAEIEWYLDTGEWEGAAGAYRLQELGACLIESIKGSPSGVAGLPLHDLYCMLRDNGYPFGA